MRSTTASRNLVPIQAAAEAWSVHPRTIRRRIADGSLTAYRLPGSRSIRVDLAELDATLRPIPAAGGDLNDAA